MKPIVSVYIDIARFYKRVTDVPFSERAQWVTQLAVSLVERDHSHPFASELLTSAQDDKNLSAAEKRKGRARKKLKDLGCDPGLADTVDDPESVLKGLTDKSRGLGSPKGSLLTSFLPSLLHSNPTTDNQKNNTGTRAQEKPRVQAYAEIPPALREIPSFCEAWADWVKYRTESKKKLTPSTVKAQMEKLSKLPDPVGSIRQSIEGGWAGLFEVKEQQGGRTTNKPVQFKNTFDHASELGDAIREGKIK